MGSEVKETLTLCKRQNYPEGREIGGYQNCAWEVKLFIMGMKELLGGMAMFYILIVVVT